MKLKLKRRAMHAISLNGEPRPGHSVDAAKPCSLFSSKANERKIYEIPMCPLPAEESKTAPMELFCRPRPTVHAERRTKFFSLEEARRRALGNCQCLSSGGDSEKYPTGSRQQATAPWVFSLENRTSRSSQPMGSVAVFGATPSA